MFPSMFCFSRNRGQAFSLSRLFVALALLTAVNSPSVTAQGNEQIIPVIVVVDLQQVMQNSKAAASLQAQLDVENDKNQAEVTPQANGVKEAREKLQDDRPTLSAADFATRRAEVDRLIAAYREEVSTRKSELQDRMNRSMVSIQQKLQSIVIEIAGERGANIVLAKGAVIIMAGEFDATQDALGRLNEQMPTVVLAE